MASLTVRAWSFTTYCQNPGCDPKNTVICFLLLYLNKGINVTVDNYFTCLQLTRTVKWDWPELLAQLGEQDQDAYHCQIIMSTSLCSKSLEWQNHFLGYNSQGCPLYLSISTITNQIKSLDTVGHFNGIKYGTDIVDKMARQCSVKGLVHPLIIFFILLQYTLSCTSLVRIIIILQRSFSRGTSEQLLD
jgi:hypothetical protein